MGTGKINIAQSLAEILKPFDIGVEEYNNQYARLTDYFKRYVIIWKAENHNKLTITFTNIATDDEKEELMSFIQNSYEIKEMGITIIEEK